MNQEQQPPPQPPAGGEDYERAPNPEPKIYVASLADYVAGRLYGRWIDAAQPPEALLAAISEVLAAAPTPGAEEWAIHDYENFGPLRLGEYESANTISTVAQGIVEHGPAFAAWASQVDIHNAEEMERFEDCYLGHWESVEAYAEDLVEDLGTLSAIEQAAGSLAPYVKVDMEALARDMELGGDVAALEAEAGGVYLFSP